MFQETGSIILFCHVNPFSTNVPLMLKPGSWFLLAECLKHLWKSDTLGKDPSQSLFATVILLFKFNMESIPKTQFFTRIVIVQIPPFLKRGK